MRTTLRSGFIARPIPTDICNFWADDAWLSPEIYLYPPGYGDTPETTSEPPNDPTTDIPGFELLSILGLAGVVFLRRRK